MMSHFSSNEDQTTRWGTDDMVLIKPKGKGNCIIVSNFIAEDGYLQLTDKEHEHAQALYGGKFPAEACELFEYVDSKEVYWTSEKFQNKWILQSR